MNVDSLFKREIRYKCWDKEREMMTPSFPIWKCSGDDSGRYIFLQYIGLKDRNGKRIYEGNIVKCYDRWHKDEEYLVEYDGAGFYPFADEDDGCPYPMSEECEIIGNIFKNPDWYWNGVLST